MLIERTVPPTISIHAPHEGVRLPLLMELTFTFISIHAPHEGVRPNPRNIPGVFIYISIHAPHEGVRHITPR